MGERVPWADQVTLRAHGTGRVITPVPPMELGTLPIKATARGAKGAPPHSAAALVFWSHPPFPCVLCGGTPLSDYCVHYPILYIRSARAQRPTMRTSAHQHTREAPARPRLAQGSPYAHAHVVHACARS